MTNTIGIFDSGLGGASVLQKIQTILPEYEYIAYFDHDNAPYGDKKSAEILAFTEKGCQQLWEQDCQLILIACNTACADSLPKLQRKYPDKKIIGCLVPTIEIAAEHAHNNIGLIATQHTINTTRYEHELQKIAPEKNLFSLATPKLVPWVENLQTESTDCRQYLRQSVETLLEKNIETLILGCTHYSVFKDFLAKAFPQLFIVDSAEAQSVKLQDYLDRHPEIFI